KQDRVAVRPFRRRAEVLHDLLDPLRGVVGRCESREVVVMGQQLARDDLGPGRSPAEDDAEIVELVAEPAREEERPQAEPRQKLRELRGMTEAVGRVSGRRRLDAEPATDAPAEQEVADERLSADE